MKTPDISPEHILSFIERLELLISDYKDCVPIFRLKEIIIEFENEVFKSNRGF